MANVSTFAALVRFQVWGAGGTALRNAIAAAMVVVLAFVIVPDPAVAARTLALALVSDGPIPARIPVALLASGVAAGAWPVLSLGFGGWLRSLPFGSDAHRRAMVLALLMPQAFLMPVILGSIAATWSLERTVDGWRVAGAMVILLGAAASAVPVTRRGLGRLLGLVAVVGGVVGSWWTVAAGGLAVLAWDRLAGPMAPATVSPRWSSHSQWLPLVITWRALGVRSLLAIVPAMVLLVIGHLFRVNNALPAEAQATAARVVTGLGVVVVAAFLGDRLALGRPPWPWSRSLPISAWRRTGDDALAVAAYLVPGIVGGGWLDRSASIAAVSVAPLACLLAVAAHRRAAGRHLLVSGRVIPLGGTIAVLVGIWPAWALGALAAAPAVWWWAARSDRLLVATRWTELHYSARGDSLSATNG